ncbi:hypothetical protein GCM10009717_21260 [Agromyces allii]|uniref:Uncharacterized protein n=1 Tax=Agromyces allii TaxID=393607 RepID=A0ABP5C1L9_9MICO
MPTGGDRSTDNDLLRTEMLRGLWLMLFVAVRTWPVRKVPGAEPVLLRDRVGVARTVLPLANR